MNSKDTQENVGPRTDLDLLSWFRSLNLRASPSVVVGVFLGLWIDCRNDKFVLRKLQERQRLFFFQGTDNTTTNRAAYESHSGGGGGCAGCLGDKSE